MDPDQEQYQGCSVGGANFGVSPEHLSPPEREVVLYNSEGVVVTGG